MLIDSTSDSIQTTNDIFGFSSGKIDKIEVNDVDNIIGKSERILNDTFITLKNGFTHTLCIQLKSEREIQKGIEINCMIRNEGILARNPELKPERMRSHRILDKFNQVEKINQNQNQKKDVDCLKEPIEKESLNVNQELILIKKSTITLPLKFVIGDLSPLYSQPLSKSISVSITPHMTYSRDERDCGSNSSDQSILLNSLPWSSSSSEFGMINTTSLHRCMSTDRTITEENFKKLTLSDKNFPDSNSISNFSSNSNSNSNSNYNSNKNSYLQSPSSICWQRSLSDSAVQMERKNLPRNHSQNYSEVPNENDDTNNNEINNNKSNKNECNFLPTTWGSGVDNENIFIPVTCSFQLINEDKNMKIFKNNQNIKITKMTDNDIKNSVSDDGKKEKISPSYFLPSLSLPSSNSSSFSLISRNVTITVVAVDKSFTTSLTLPLTLPHVNFDDNDTLDQIINNLQSELYLELPNKWNCTETPILKVNN